MATCGTVVFLPARTAHAAIVNDPTNQRIAISDDSGQLSLTLDYNGKSLITSAVVRGREVLSIYGASTAIRTTDSNWYTTRSGLTSPAVSVQGNVAKIGPISYGGSGVDVVETWTFTANQSSIGWDIERTYPSAGTLLDTYFPGFDFASATTWKGAMLDNGGVAWMSLLGGSLATLGTHSGAATLWDTASDSILKIVPTIAAGTSVATRVTNQPNGSMTFCNEVTSSALTTQNDFENYLPSSDAVWSSFAVNAGTLHVSYDLSAAAYSSTYDLGTLNGIDAAAVREMNNTIARYGVIDNDHVGLNGWRSGYVCLHEPFLGKVAAALGQPDYTRALQDAYTYYKANAVEPSGRVLSRFKTSPGDEQPGTYTPAGFYEAQWGTLLDSQPDYVLVVSDIFNLTGDVAWVTAQKATCESALDYLLARDSNQNGLVEMMDDSDAQGKSSDWLDVVWAAYENGLVNAELYGALIAWAAVEDALGDSAKAAGYRARALKLQTTFNSPIEQGGLWDATNNQYIYWREADGSLHGENLVIPVQFAAIGYGVSDDPTRVNAIVSNIENKTAAEGLFTWPLSMTGYADGEQGSGAFPNYENGDLFLSWNELGVRSYVKYSPDLAVKYVNSVVKQYGSDGLAYQRYLRQSQTGTGDDILAGNYMVIAGLYSSVYGVQPLYNRLYLEPNLPAALNGTVLQYNLRGIPYTIGLKAQNEYSVSAAGITVADGKPFSVGLDVGGQVTYYQGDQATESMTIAFSPVSAIALDMTTWSPAGQQWSEESDVSATATHTVAQLTPDTPYTVYVNGTPVSTAVSDSRGTLGFGVSLEASLKYELRLAPGSAPGADAGDASGGVGADGGGSVGDGEGGVVGIEAGAADGGDVAPGASRGCGCEVAGGQDAGTTFMARLGFPLASIVVSLRRRRSRRRAR